jgi:glycosyltransferase involved in cell wall biosynthesis
MSESPTIKVGSRRRLAYLMSEYPAVATVFMMREIRKLRALEFDINVASINSTGRDPADLAIEEREEARATFYVKEQGVVAALRAHLAFFLTRPIHYVLGMLFALRLGGSDIVRLFYSVLYFSEALILGRWIESRRLKHLHVHFANPAATVGLIASRMFGLGFSMTVHGPEEFYDVTGHVLAQKIAGASFVCCIGHFTRSQLMKLSSPDQWGKLEFVPCGVDTNLFNSRGFRARPNPFEVLCVGRLAPAKGHHTLLRAMERLVKRGREVRLRLVGDGPARASLELAVRKLDLSAHVIFEGIVNQDKIRDLYAVGDAFVLPSFAEGVPGVLMEAMAMEIACVATYVGGVPELIRPEVDGIVVPASDDRALAEAIERLIDDPQLRRRFGLAGRQRVIRYYDLDRNVARLAQVFDRRLGFQMEHAELDHSLNVTSSAELDPSQANTSAD